MSGRHSDRRRPRGVAALWTALPLIGLVVVCLATAGAVTFGLSGQSDKQTFEGAFRPASVEAVAFARAAKKSQRGDVTRLSPVSRSAGPRTRQRPAPAPEPLQVVGGQVIAHKTKVQIDAELRAAAERAAARQAFSFTIGSFNVLGSQHTTRSGDHPNFPSAGWRNGAAVGLIRSHGVDVLGTQELQPDQLNALQAMTGMAAYPGYQFGSRETDNSILYDTSRFEFVSGSYFTIHFMHTDRPQTILKLRERSTGREVYFLNMHASAGAGGYAVTRRAGHFTAAATINRLKAEGLPVFLTGDMNDRAEFYCRVAPITGLVAAVGGSASGGCAPAPALAVDWVLGLGGVSFSNYWEDRSAVARKISDHFFVSAVANVAPAL